MFSYISAIFINIISSFIFGFITGTWVNLRNKYSKRSKRKFFKIHKGDLVYITINERSNSPKTMSHRDILTLMETSKIANDLEGEILLEPIDTAKIAPGNQVEFCIGGIDSNKRSKIFLSKFFRNISMNSFKDSNSLRISVDGINYDYVKGKRAYAILARIFPTLTSKPIFLLCGQTSLSNRAAAYYLEKNYNLLLKKYRKKSFCMVLEIEDFEYFGFKSGRLAEDVTTKVFPR